MNDEKYNGYSNRETWLVPLWWNDCPVEELEVPDACYDSETLQDRKLRALEEALEAFFDEFTELPENGLVADLLGGAIARIDWRDIAENWVDDVTWSECGEDEEETEDEETEEE